MKLKILYLLVYQFKSDAESLHQNKIQQLTISSVKYNQFITVDLYLININRLFLAGNIQVKASY